MHRAAPLLLALVAAAAVTACDPYDPDLGQRPFKCGTSEPYCPDGYTCSGGVCERSAGDDTDAATSQFQCADDSTLEPNEDISRAFVTPIPNMPSYTLRGLAICPGSDRDHFQFSVNTNGINFEATVAGVAGRTPLSLNVLNNSGTLIGSGAPSTSSPQLVSIELPARLAIGTYYIQVQSQDQTENNYDLAIRTCTTPLPCPAP